GTIARGCCRTTTAVHCNVGMLSGDARGYARLGRGRSRRSENFRWRARKGRRPRASRPAMRRRGPAAEPRSPGLEECGSDATCQLGVEQSKDPPPGARSARLPGLEVNAGKAEPGLRRVVLQCDRLAKRTQRPG